MQRQIRDLNFLEGIWIICGAKTEKSKHLNQTQNFLNGNFELLDIEIYAVKSLFLK